MKRSAAASRRRRAVSKVCCRCRQEKPLDQFDRKSKLTGGFASKCKACRNDYARYWRRTPKGAIRQKQSQRKLSESGYYKKVVYSINARFSRAKARASIVGLSWSIDFSAYEQLVSLPCAYCDLSLNQKFGYGLDRLNNDLGYDPNNVAPCCSECNRIRSDKYTPEEMKKIFGPAVRQMRLTKEVQR
jgi:hypothetical protein